MRTSSKISTLIDFLIMMDSRTRCSSWLLGYAIIIIVVVIAASNNSSSVFAFAPPSCAAVKSIQRRTSITSSSTTTKLFGYAQVNDYFNSFNDNDDNGLRRFTRASENPSINTIPFILFNMKLDLPKLVATATYHVIMSREPPSAALERWGGFLVGPADFNHYNGPH